MGSGDDFAEADLAAETSIVDNPQRVQAQFETISCFKEKLKAGHSSALYPNFLAVKWREEWEKEKRRQKGKDWRDSIYSHESTTTREEDEVR